MKAIFKLFILNLLALALLPSCSDDDQSNSEQNDPVSGNISPVGSFSVEATNNENELLVKWTNPSNRDVDMVELSYRDVETSLSRATDFSPGHIIIMDRARYGRLVHGNERDALSDTGKGGVALPD